MEVKVIIKTPPGRAEGSQKLLEKMLLPTFKKIKLEVYVSETNDKILWLIDAPIKDVLNINKKVAMFDSVITQIFTSRAAKAAIKKLADSKEDIEILKEMLKKNTSVEIIKGQVCLEGFKLIASRR